MNTILHVQRLSKKFENADILRDIDFELKENDFVAIMGPSGSGKSTFLNMISGMDKPTKGDVFYFDKSIADLNEKQMSSFRLEKIGFVFQKSSMLDTLCLYDNILLPAYTLKKEQRYIINKRASLLMEKMEIADKASEAVHHLSGGQLQRGCICRAMINNPAVLFADEPTGALNSQATDQVMKSFENLHMDGATILLVTHNPYVAAYADRIVYLADGKITKELKMNKQMDIIERHKTVSGWVLARTE